MKPWEIAKKQKETGGFAPIPEPVRPRTVQTPEMGALEGFLGGVAQGAGFNLMDEAAGLGRSWLYGGSPELNRRMVQEEYETAPLAARLPGEVLGAVGAGMGIGSIGSRALPRATQAFEALPAVVRGGLAGATSGAVYGAGGSDPGSRMEGAGWGGLLGGGLGAAVPIVPEIGRRAIRPFTRPPQEKAARTLSEFLDYDVPGGASRQAARMRQLGDYGMIADIGENTQSLARGVHARPSVAKRELGTKLKDRQIRQNRRVAEFATQIMDPENKGRSLLNLRQRRTNQANQAFEDARQAVPTFTSANVIKDMSRPEVRAHLRKWENITGRKIPVNDNGDIIEIPFDAASFAYSRVSEGARNALSAFAEGGRSGTMANALNTARRELLESMGSENPKYSTAVRRFAEESDLMAAVAEGTKFGSKLNNPHAAQEYIKGLSLAEREMFVGGMVDGIRDAVELGLSQRTVNKILRQDAVKDALKLALPKGSYNNFVREVRRVAEQTETANKLLGGSPTSRIDAERDVIETLGFAKEMAADLVRGDVLGAAGKTASRALERKALGHSGKDTEILASMLTTQGREAEKLISQLPAMSQPQALRPWSYQSLAFPMGAGAVTLTGND